MTAVSLVGVDRAAVIVDAARRKSDSDSCVSRQRPSAKAALIAGGERVTAVPVDRERL